MVLSFMRLIPYIMVSSANNLPYNAPPHLHPILQRLLYARAQDGGYSYKTIPSIHVEASNFCYPLPDPDPDPSPDPKPNPNPILTRTLASSLTPTLTRTLTLVVTASLNCQPSLR